ncbi:hypothetical protein RR46_08010 [Papilio xuthus]|uniref:Uncharacterized protein n=1 Tax=Papilio xuthus TaxID=66420 RepID=A0A194Q9M8_PAPXU|nr:hypothetical protein RR46_08010 [Papilio xuthus]
MDQIGITMVITQHLHDLMILQCVDIANFWDTQLNSVANIWKTKIKTKERKRKRDGEREEEDVSISDMSFSGEEISE